ncbi:MAG: Fic family protein [bacterium]|nr:Fic family protein [bacterium]
MPHKWCWEHNNWPQFEYDSVLMDAREDEFWHESGKLWGASTHLTENNKTELRIELMSDEAIFNAEIEGEFLERDSVQRSLKRHFGLAKNDTATLSKGGEDGMVELMLDMQQAFDAPLCETSLMRWHSQLLAGREQELSVGQYRTGNEPMQIVSGAIYAPKVHYEALPSARVSAEMAGFIAWYNATAPNQKEALFPLTRAAITHLYFELIHPFEDGNGRLGRALVEKALAQALGYPPLIALSRVLKRHQKQYYAALASANRSLDITQWLVFFSEMVLISVAYSNAMVRLFIHKTHTFTSYKDQLNDRQIKALTKLYAAGPSGFTGGLSAANYLSITRTSRATATRDLNELVDLGILDKTGERRHTRYYVKLRE